MEAEDSKSIFKLVLNFETLLGKSWDISFEGSLKTPVVKALILILVVVLTV